MKNGLDKLNQYREELKSEREREIQFLNEDASENFVSLASLRHNISLLNMKIRILENEGLYDFEALFHLDGTLVKNSKLCNTRFGKAFRVEKEDGTIEWVNPKVKEKTLEKKGYKLGLTKKPAWCKLDGSGHGLGSLMSVYVSVFESDFNHWTGK